MAASSRRTGQWRRPRAAQTSSPCGTARDTLAGFRLDDANAAAVAAICRRLDGLPLALELAAPHLATLAPEALLARLAWPLDLLIDGPCDLPERQHVLRDTIAWSDDLLDPDARSLLHRLSVAPDGASLEHLRALASPEDDEYAGADPRDALVTLLAHHLVRRCDDGAGGTPRYGLLATIRDYAIERSVASGKAGTDPRVVAGTRPARR